MTDDRIDKASLQQQAARAVALLQLWKSGVGIIDEVDVVLHPLKSELNWPLGDKHALDFAPTRWELPWWMLHALLLLQEEAKPESQRASWLASGRSSAGLSGRNSAPASKSVSSTSAEAERECLLRLKSACEQGIAGNYMQRVPHLALLSEEWYHATLKPLMGSWLLIWLRRTGLHDISDDAAIRCLAGGGVEGSMANSATLSDKQAKMLNLGHDWLTYLLPHVLRKISRVHFGLIARAREG